MWYWGGYIIVGLGVLYVRLFSCVVHGVLDCSSFTSIILHWDDSTQNIYLYRFEAILTHEYSLVGKYSERICPLVLWHVGLLSYTLALHLHYSNSVSWCLIHRTAHVFAWMQKKVYTMGTWYQNGKFYPLVDKCSTIFVPILTNP